MLMRPQVIPDFDTIFTEFHPKVLRYLSGMVGSIEAEDVAQNVFLKVHSGLKNYRGEASLATWIFRIATNTALDRLRLRSVRQTEQLDAETESADAELSGALPMQSAESALIRGEMNECIRSYVDALPDSYRLVLALSDLDELTDQGIAEILGVSVAAVKIRLHRARHELKKRFKAGCEFYRTEDNKLACDQRRSVCSSLS